MIKIGGKQKIEEERKNNMENMLSEILNEIRDLKVTNEKEFKEIKEKQNATCEK